MAKKSSAESTRQLLVLRHAKSSWDTPAATDFERPLATRGEKDAPRMGRWLHEQGLRPDWILGSPATRAKQTLLAVCRELGFPSKAIRWEPAIYEGELRDLLPVLGGCPDGARRVLLVGHNPGLETLVTYLGGQSVTIPEDGKLLPAGALALLEVKTPWSTLAAGGATLLSVIRPRDVAPAGD